MKISFFGGARSVTGANYLLEHDGLIMLVDCGLFQGSPEAEHLNYENFPYTASEIDFVFVTHSHADHTGRLPKLYKEGFRGKLLSTEPTLDLIRKALPDNLSLLKDEAKYHGHAALFDSSDITNILNLSQGLKYGNAFNCGRGITVTFHDAGHVLGSAIVEIRWDGKRIYFSGDLGNPPTPLLPEPFFPDDADYIVIESAYGSRIHENKSERSQLLIQTIINTINRGGTLMIPAFALERTQELLYELNNLINEKKIPPVPIYMDSPLAISLTEVYHKYGGYFNKTAKYILKSDDDIFNFPGLRITKSSEESKEINEVIGPKVIIAGSGMSNGGRIQHHEKRYLPDPNSTILFIGYQSEGTPGRKILDGQRTVRILGEIIPVRCDVVAIGGYSAHADQELLLKWVAKCNEAVKLKTVFIVQGELESAEALAARIKNDLNIDSIIPSLGQEIEL